MYIPIIRWRALWTRLILEITNELGPPRDRRPSPWEERQTRLDPNDAIHSDPDISGGTPVFRGTRVPVRSLFDYLEGGDSLDEFLKQFPSVSKEQARKTLRVARDYILTSTRPT